MDYVSKDNFKYDPNIKKHRCTYRLKRRKIATITTAEFNAFTVLIYGTMFTYKDVSLNKVNDLIATYVEASAVFDALLFGDVM